VPKPPLSLLSRLWLREPDASALAQCRQFVSLSPHIADPAELASAYTDLFLLNVYPYGTVFTDPSGELNAPGAWSAAERFEVRGFQTRELSETGAPDHMGLLLGFLDHLSGDSSKEPELFSDFAQWAPVCCFAVERETSAHPFYRALASATLGQLMDLAAPLGDSSAELPIAPAFEEEIALSDIVRFLLAPARSGFFLSRAKLGRLAKALGMRLSFVSRFEVAQLLFGTAGETGRVEELLEAISAEAGEWEAAYREWARQAPSWAACASRWLERIAATHLLLREMRQTLKASAPASA
jgi:TorA maturation chaperone TorD